MLRLRCRRIKVLPEAARGDQLALELPRAEDAFRLQMICELARVRFEVCLPGFPLLDELEASRVRAHSDAHALDRVCDVLPRALGILSPPEMVRRGRDVVRVTQEFEQGFPRPLCPALRPSVEASLQR